MAEIWKPVRGYERICEVSNTGKIRSLDRLERAVTESGNTQAATSGNLFERGVDL